MSHAQLAAPDIVVVDSWPAIAIHIGVVCAVVGYPHRFVARASACASRARECCKIRGSSLSGARLSIDRNQVSCRRSVIISRLKGLRRFCPWARARPAISRSSQSEHEIGDLALHTLMNKCKLVFSERFISRSISTDAGVAKWQTQGT
jgi:hypothetical protein